MVFGFVYAASSETGTPAARLKVLEGDGVTTILLFTAGVGVVLSLISGVLNLITGFRQKDYRKALFSANGVTGVLFLAGIVGYAASDALLPRACLHGHRLVHLRAAALHLVQEAAHQHDGSRPRRARATRPPSRMMILEGFFELFEALP